MVFECSGKHAEFPDEVQDYLVGDTKQVVISATSWDADKTLIFGFNHQDYNPETDKVVSYGSCTVNAYVPLAKWVNDKYGINNSDVHVVHNRPGYTLDDPKNHTLFRKACTLERSGPNLLGFLDQKDFLVDYTVGPFTNVSGITMRFDVKNPVAREEFIRDLHQGFNGELKGLYCLDDVDVGDSNRYNCTPFSTVFTENGIQVRGNNLFLQGYFDNENSVNRFYDLVNYIAAQDGLKK